ncbi:MAG: hypothetical protein WAN36_00380, partial [Calditrichia bacterium]
MAIGSWQLAASPTLHSPILQRFAAKIRNPQFAICNWQFEISGFSITPSLRHSVTSSLRNFVTSSLRHFVTPSLRFSDTPF